MSEGAHSDVPSKTIRLCQAGRWNALPGFVFEFEIKLRSKYLHQLTWNFDSGGKCLPIALRQEHRYYKHIVDIVDGILLPGGGFSLADSEGYTPSGRHLLDAVTCAAEDGRVIPIFGICLGFELMALYFSDVLSSSDILTEIPINKGWHELSFTADADSSSLFTAELLDRLRKNSLSYFLHRQCVTVEKFEKMGNDWRALATEEVREEGKEELTVVTVMESKSKPYLGVQFHPEKVKHESGPRGLCPNIGNAESATEVFNDLLRRMIAQNVPHKFPVDETKRLIDRCTPEDVTNISDIKYDYVYMFKHGDLVI